MGGGSEGAQAPPSRWRALLCGLCVLALTGASESLDCPDFKALCVQAERSGRIDLKTGTATLEGNVHGYIRAQQLDFRADTLKAYRNDKNEWVRLVLDRAVRLTQPDAVSTAAHSILEPEKILLYGDGKMVKAPYRIEGEKILVEDSSGRISVEGTETRQVVIHYNQIQPAPAAPSAAPGGDGRGEPPEAMLIRADKAVIDQGANRMELTGNVYVHRRRLNWTLWAKAVTLEMDEAQNLKGFRAQGGVKIEQPGRTLSADVAESQNNNETVLLTGDATIRQEQEFLLTSDQIEVYTDAKKGVVRSQDRQQPVKLTFDMAPKKPYRLTPPGLETLRAGGVPPETLDKLKPLLGISHSRRSGLSGALREVLMPLEADLYLEKILEQAN